MESSMKDGMPIDRHFDQSTTPDPLVYSHEISHGNPDIREPVSKPSSISSLLELATHIWQGREACIHKQELQQEFQETNARSSREKEVTSILDTKQLMNDIQVRHNLNFSRQITFGSSITREQIDLARRYFEAVSFELVLYLAGYGKTQMCICGRRSSITEIKRYPKRLPKFFEAVRKTMIALTRDEHWTIIEQAIDVDLLMNQLRSGTSDLLPLVIWLGDVLKQSCSPIRDTQVDTVTSLLRLAVLERNGNKLASGMGLLFDIFKTMKLDVTNHHMLHLLPPLVDKSVEFVQKKYQEQIDNNTLNHRSLWKWFHEKRELFNAKAKYDHFQADEEDYEMETEIQDIFPDEEYLTRYTEIVFTEVIKIGTPLSQLPEPFKLDLQRIDTYRREVSRIFEQQREIAAFTIILRQCRQALQPSPSDETNLLMRTAYIKSQLLPGPEQRECIALEIVRVAYQAANYPSSILPDPLHICQAKDMLNEKTYAGQILAHNIRTRLHQMLEDIVFEEINGSHGIADLLPSQILDRYASNTTASNSTTDSTSRPIPAAESLSLAIRSVAQRLAHITLIQWRIWAQMLWFKSRTVIFTSEREFEAWKDGIERGIQRSYPRYRCEML